jgi:protein involved in polysaccharide export with SLBB domain
MTKGKYFAVYFVVILSLALNACSSNQSTIVAEQTEPVLSVSEKPGAPFLIRPGDELEIKFFYNPELNEKITVRPDGKISLQLVDEVQAAGRTPAKLDDYLTEKYSKELRKPVVTVIVRSFSGQRIYVGGEVSREGLITMAPGMTALQAVFQAGGFLDTAKPSETLVIRKGDDNRPVPIEIDLEAGRREIGSGSGFTLQPDDVVFVPKSEIAEANLFVNQYIERLLLFRGVSLGFSYELRDTN